MDLELGSGNGFRVTANDASDTAMRVTTTGDLHILGSLYAQGGDGTTDPGDNFPDYVFEEDYPLMPLSDLAAFIADQKHLPNVPSAADISRAATINMTDLQLRLLEKIEELTLYTLEQQQTIDSLRADLDSLKEGNE